MKKHRRADNIMLAVALFTVSGAGLIYNLSTAAGEEIAVSLSGLAKTGEVRGSAISEYAAANLIEDETVAVSFRPAQSPVYDILPPIITDPAQ